MNETTGDPAGTCLAITEKKAHRPGGCVGIFFQLFEWNRRFAKKKLFSRKLLPAARAKQPSKKFGGDEKMPKTKLHLIVDENKGGFPNVKKSGNCNDDIVVKKHDMRAPSLVARLMGLDSLPTVHRDKHKKVSNSVACDVTEEKLVNGSHSESDRNDFNMEKGGAKVESRPQKLQKTGQFERQALTRFGADVLQINGALSRSRRHHHPKLAPPFKSPRISSSKNASRTSRLIDAATRILEPGLHATNRSKKSALTYPSSMNSCLRDEVSTEEIGIMLPKQDIGDCNEGEGMSFIGQTSCKNCGNLFDVVDSRPNVKERQFVCPSTPSYYMSSQESEMMKPRPPISTPEQERNTTYQRNWDQQSIAVEEQDNTRVRSQTITVIRPVSPESQSQRQLRSQQCRPQQQESSSITYKQRNQTQNEMFISRDRTPPRAKQNNLQSRRASSAAYGINEARDSVALNRSIISRGRTRASNLVNNSTIDKDRKVWKRQDDSMSPPRSPVRKRTAGFNAQVESTGFPNPMSVRQRNTKSDSVSREVVSSSSSTIDRACIKSGSVNDGESNKDNCSRENDAISLTFNSPSRHRTFVSKGLKERSHQIDKSTSHQRRLVLDENDGKTPLQNRFPFRGDALGTVLEQKLKELASQEQEELTSGGSHPMRSAALILQELIFALTADQPMSPHAHMFNADKTCQEEGKIRRNSVGISADGAHLSPGSVLEASFSNDSCLSSSLDDSSGRRMLLDYMDCSHDQPQPVDTDADLLDCASSLIQGRAGSKMAIDLLNHVSRILQSINLAGVGLTGNKLTHAKEVILNAELLFGCATPCHSDRMKRFLVGPFLFDGLETLAGAMRKNLNCNLGFEEEEGNKLGKFLFDSVIECLDSKYIGYINTGFKTWKRVPPSCMDSKILIKEIGEEVRRWTDFAGMIPDEIIDWEMNHSLGKWTDFEIEGFEAGAEIDGDILQTLVEEIAIDLWSAGWIPFEV
ncbi:hypothetical protein SADUNF_Sadunf04G0085300 [Salix dunnii]|uniref:DUF4378 domain-containing protein n=1 Tax=Salix dunnii TaxID=1413687 RepID=A0A835N0P9_9ROSI|nr:hypothetical protein SADUNF_Sadunf04G0085300 [Salix dunnii]